MNINLYKIASNPSKSFTYFLITNKLVRIGSICWLTLSLVFWLIFKYAYSNPNMCLDSYYYTKSAILKSNVSAWPIGYSWILRLIGFFSHSPSVLVSLQYFFLQSSLLFLCVTVIYLFKLNKISSIFLFIIFLFNPAYIYVSNYILSDSIFISFSIFWFTSLLWILVTNNNVILFLNAILLLITFAIRYSGFYYPIIGIFIVLIGHNRWYIKLSFISFQILLISAFILFTIKEMKSNYGVNQFCPFGAWKKANNALYMYEHVYKSDTWPIPAKFKKLDNIVRNYFDSSHVKVDLITSDFSSGSFYMFMVWEPKSPLIKYLNHLYGNDYEYINFEKWAKLGPLYNDYANFIIRKHPIDFLYYVTYPNIIRYFHPHTEIFTDEIASYNLRKDISGYSAIEWFKLNTLSAPKDFIKLKIYIFHLFPLFISIIHFLFLMSCSSFFLFKGFYNHCKEYSWLIILIFILSICNFLFSIVVGSSLIRYEIFIITV